MWFPFELWRIIKNYQLGKKYWMIKFSKVLEELPKRELFIYTSYVYKNNKIRFFKQFEKTSKIEIIKVYSIYIPPPLNIPLPYDNHTGWGSYFELD